MQTSTILELLEEKIVPAGIVSVAYNPGAAGSLTITGDGADNVITITEAPGQLLLSDGLGNGTLFSVNGALAAANPVVNLTVGLGLTNINLQAGNDVLQVNGVTFGGHVTITDTAGGNDSVVFSNTTANRTLSISLGAGDDSLQVSGTQFNAGVTGGAMSVALDDGNNTLTIDNTVDFRANAGFSATAGVGSNTFNITPNTLVVGGTFGITTTGTAEVPTIIPATLQTVNISPVATGQVGSHFTLSGTNGNHAFTVQGGTGAFTIGGTLSVGAGVGNDSLSVANLDITSTTVFDLGGGNNSLTHTGGNLSAPTIRWGAASGGSAGNDTLNFSGTSLATTGTSGFALNLGNGTNVVNFNSGTVSLGGGTTAINGGTGSDSLTIAGTSFAAGGTLSLALSDGANTVDISTASLTSNALSYSGGTGIDMFGISGTSTNAALSSLSVTTGAGNDTVNLGGSALTTTSASGFTVNLGDGTNVLNFNSGTFGFAGGTSSISGGSGQDTVNLQAAVTSFTNAGTLSVNLGSGLNRTTLAAATFSTAALNYTGTTGNDTFELTSANATVTGALAVNTGTGANSVNIESPGAMNLAAVTITNAGALGQAQTINVTAATSASVTGALTITNTAGIGTISVGGLPGSTSFNLTSGLTITSGSEMDTLTLGRLTTTTANIDLKAGSNTTTALAGSVISAGTFNYGPVLSSPGGAEGDSLQFNGTSFATTAHNGFTLNLGAGTNTVGFNSGTFALGTGTNNIKGGLGQDTITVGVGASFVSTGALSFDLGDGTNSATIAGSAFTAGPLTYVGTNGADTFALTSSAATINGAINVTTGAGSNTVNIAAAGTLTSGAITVTNAGTAGQAQTINVTAVTSASVTGALTITNTAGIGTISVGGLPGSTSFNLTTGLAITSGSNDDTLTLGRLTSTSASVLLGAGNNTVNTTGAINTGAFTYGSGVVGSGNDVLTFNGSLNANATTFHLGAGNNALTFNQSVDLGGNLAVNGGTGNDDLAINNTFDVTGTATFNMDAGQNTLMVNTSNLTVSGALAYTGGAGSDLINVEGTAANLGSLNVNAGNGLNELALWSTTTTLTTSLQYTGGSGTDTVEIGDFELGGTTVNVGTLVNVQMGDGANALGVQGATIGGAFTANSTLTRRLTADVVRVYESSITGATNITMGSGSSIVDLQDVTMAAVNISTAAGSDIVLLDNISSIGTGLNGSTFNGAFSLNLGTGDDFLYAGSSPNLDGASNTFNSTVSIDGGTGTDTALILDPTTPPGATRNNTFFSTPVLTSVEVLG